MSSVRNIVATAKAIHAELGKEIGPPEEGLLASTQPVIVMSLVRNTRGYIERVAFERHKIASKIQNASGDFFYLRDLIDRTLAESAWNLGRNAKQALPKLKDIGDKSAHSRRYIAQRGDIQPLLSDIRTVVQELLHVAGLK